MILRMTRRARRNLAILMAAILAFHVLGMVAAVIAVAFPNIFKRNDKHSPELAARIPHESVVFRSRRGRELHGWFFSKPGATAAVLLCHGRSRDKAHEMPYVRDFLQDYDVFVFDFPGHGENPYAATSIGYNESADVLGAVDWLESRGITRIAVMGHSMGGAAAIKAVSEYGEGRTVPKLSNEGGPVRIEAVIAEGVFADLNDLLHRQANRLLLPPTVWWPAFGIAERLGGYRIKQNRPEKFIGRVECPTLILQADGDSLVPADSATRLHSSSGGPSEVVVFKGKHDVPCDDVSSNALRFLRVHLQPEG